MRCNGYEVYWCGVLMMKCSGEEVNWCGVFMTAPAIIITETSMLFASLIFRMFSILLH